MPSVRSWILIAVCLAVLSLLLAWVSLFQTPDSGGRGRDTFGTRESGYRAIFETLSELGIKVDRQFHPPVSLSDGESLVFLNPSPDLCGTEPAYLESLLPSVEAGGRVVVATRTPIREELQKEILSEQPMKLPGILESLDLADVRFEAVDGNFREWVAEDSFSDTLFKERPKPRPPRIVKVECTGTMARWQSAIQELALSGDLEQSLVWENTEPIGQISYLAQDQEKRVVAAEFPRGKGSLLVVDEALFHNRLLPQSDNSIAAAYLISPEGTPAAFDEFYHGLGVRGNPLYLLTLPGYAALFLGLLLFVGLNSWRRAVFLGPAIPDEPKTRRDIREYLSAMGQFYSQGRNSRKFLIRQMQEGVVRELNLDYGLPLESQDIDLLLTRMARKNPARAKQIREALENADGMLNSPRQISETQTLETMRRLTACL